MTLYSFGVIDPVKVSRSALSNVASIAGMLLTTESLVAGYLCAAGVMPEKKSAAGGHSHDHDDY